MQNCNVHIQTKQRRPIPNIYKEMRYQAGEVKTYYLTPDELAKYKKRDTKKQVVYSQPTGSTLAKLIYGDVIKKNAKKESCGNRTK